MKIPNKYKLFDNEIVTKYFDDLADTTDCNGQWYSQLNTIKLQTVNSGLSKERQEWVFFHELVHSILFNMSETTLNKNEDFVNRFASLLKQAINTMEFEDDTEAKTTN